MNRYFNTYCTLLVLLLAYANYQGYVFTSVFDSPQHAAQSANHYHK